ncbi:MAG: multidrug effflux MFS transporter [Gammaproteobacteria bacterium]|nr:multidrug effflux MFS transporter [Gammaproteobacteria bacterium]
MSSKTQLQINNFKLFFTILLLFFTIGQISSVIYVPALPYITKALRCSDSTIQWTVSIFMLGFAFSQFIYGPFSDNYGRKKTLMIGIFLGLIGSLFCIFTTTPIMLMIGRFIQGFGFGVGGALGYIVLRDLFIDTELARYGSILGMMAPLMVGIAPILGGYLQHLLGWRSIFVFLFVYGFILWVTIIFLFQETKHNVNKRKSSPLNTLNIFKSLLSNKIFLGYTLCNICAYGGFMAFYTLGPFLLTNIGISAVGTGWLVALLDLAIIVGSVVNIIFVRKIGINKMMFIGTMLMIFSGIVMLAADLLHFVNVIEIMLPAFTFALGAILIMCNAFSGAMTPFPEASGAAGGLLGGLQMLGGTLSSAAVAVFTTFDKEILLSSIYLILGVISILALKSLANPKINFEAKSLD